MSKAEQVSLSCKAYCQHKDFQERFKTLKQISGKISWAIRRWYRYCSTCGIWLRMKFIEKCECCGYKLRLRVNTAQERRRKYYLKNKTMIMERQRERRRLKKLEKSQEKG